MPVPMGKTAITLIRYLLRPINNNITKRFKHINGQPDSRMFWFFVRIGNGFNRFEVTMNRIIIQQKGLGSIKALQDDAAFNKGVDWFTEIVFFYGVLFGIAFYELAAAHKKSVAQAKLLKDMEVSTKSTRTKLEQMHTDVDRVKSLQRNN